MLDFIQSSGDFVNMPNIADTIKLIYFNAGHTFMSVNSFHQEVDKEMKDKKKVCEWSNFLVCVKHVGYIYKMKAEEFRLFESGLSQNKLPKERPLLESVSFTEFQKGSTLLFSKTCYGDIEYCERKLL